MSFVISGQRVGLAKPERRWFEQAVAWLNDFNINKTLITEIPWPPNVDDIENWLGDTNPPTSFFIFDLNNSKIPVGLSHFHSYNSGSKWIKLAALIDISYQNKGFGTETVKLMVDYAFNRFDIHRIALSAFNSNPAGLRAYEKAGFVKEVVRKKALFRNGEWFDDITMSILRSEWLVK